MPWWENVFVFQTVLQLWMRLCGLSLFICKMVESHLLPILISSYAFPEWDGDRTVKKTRLLKLKNDVSFLL